MPDLTVSRRVSFGTAARGRRTIEPPSDPRPPAPPPLPRVTRLMALAIKLDGLIASGAATDQAELARAGCVTRARVTQIMNLLHLAPDIQEAILDLPPVQHGRDPITERDLRPIAAVSDWTFQRKVWSETARRSLPSQARNLFETRSQSCRKSVDELWSGKNLRLKTPRTGSQE